MQIIGQIFAVDRGVPLFNTLVRGQLLNLGLPKLDAKKLETSIYHRCRKVFDILNHLGVDRAEVAPDSHRVVSRKSLTSRMCQSQTLSLAYDLVDLVAKSVVKL